MNRENIYDLVVSNYGVITEVRKIHDILTQETFFYIARSNKQQNCKTTYRFFDFADKALFIFMPDTDTCLNLAEFMSRADAILEFSDYSKITDDRVINYLEVVENLLHVYFRRKRYFKNKRGIEICSVPYNDVVFLMAELERYLRVSKKVRRNKVILVQR